MSVVVDSQPGSRIIAWGDTLRVPFLNISPNRTQFLMWHRQKGRCRQKGSVLKCFTFDGEKLLFVSGRPNGFIYSVTRSVDGWTDPEPLEVQIPSSSMHGWQFTMAADGTLYFELWGNDGKEAPDLFKSELIDEEYSESVKIDVVNITYNEFSPYVAPDQEYIILVSNRPGGYGMRDLYVSFKGQDGEWGQPINMGPGINTDFEDAAPLVSPDGKYFFFNTVKEGDAAFNPYWVDARVITDLKGAR